MSLDVTLTWIPVEQAYPRAGETVLLALKDGWVKSWLGWTDGKRWFLVNGEEPYARVAYWAELPMTP